MMRISLPIWKSRISNVGTPRPMNDDTAESGLICTSGVMLNGTIVGE